MTSTQIFSIVLLVIAFAVAINRQVNVGLVTMAAGGLLCVVAPVPIDTYYKGFPGKLVLLILGVSFLFGHARNSGAIDRLIDGAVSLTGHRAWLLPWIMFALAAVLSAIGALPVASLAIVVPLAMRSAIRHNISLLLMGLVTISGALAGGFSPISVWGQLVASITSGNGQTLSGGALFGIEFVLNLACGVVAFLACGGVSLMRRPVRMHSGNAAPASDTSPVPRAGPSDQLAGASFASGPPVERGGAPTSLATPHGMAVQTPGATLLADQPLAGLASISLYEIASIAVTIAFVAVVLIFDADVGLTALAGGAVLQIVFRPDEAATLRNLPWSVILVVSGVLLYVGLLDKVGTLDAIARHLQSIGSIGIAVLALCFLGSLFASFESSSVAVLGIIVPIIFRVVPHAGGAELLLVVSAVCWSVVVVSASPYHVSGALVLASSPQDTQVDLFRKLLIWALGFAAVVPLAAWVLALVGGV